MKNSIGEHILTGPVDNKGGTMPKQGNFGPGTSTTGVIAEINKKPSA